MTTLKNKQWTYLEGTDYEHSVVFSKDIKEAVLEFEEIIENIDYTQNPEDIKILLKSWKTKIFGDWEVDE
jgi:hypothetical protein